MTYENSTVTAIVDEVNKKVDAETANVVFHSDVPLLITDGKGTRKVRNSETNAGDIVTDAMRHAMRADIAVINGGAIRTDVAAGDIRYRAVLDLLPFNDNVRKIEATGATILKALQLGVQIIPGESGEFVQVSGLKYTASASTHIVSDVQVLQADGTYAPLDPNRHYTVALPDYCITQGGLNGAFMGCTTLVNSHVLYRDYLVAFVNKVLGGNIGQDYAKPQGRITIAE
jgi:2',3'-cyclic-nucleotide 2'-phosphodiesterase (5'-nucleotidase family)